MGLATAAPSIRKQNHCGYLCECYEALLTEEICVRDSVGPNLEPETAKEENGKSGSHKIDEESERKPGRLQYARRPDYFNDEQGKCTDDDVTALSYGVGCGHDLDTRRGIGLNEETVRHGFSGGSDLRAYSSRNGMCKAVMAGK